jgi:5-formyltetrahydrofolate cyclo-ligase
MMEPDHLNSLPVPEVTLQKRQLRQSCRQIRLDLGEPIRQQASQAICAWIEAWPVFQHSSVILAYLPMPGEVDLTPLLHCQPQKQWVLPRIIPAENHCMVFHPYQSGRLVRHPYGMPEPAPDLPAILPADIQLALVPGLAFDHSGRRLGYGGGYFDRFLCNFQGTSLGITFQALLFDRLPGCAHDVPVQWVVTELGFLQASPADC